MLERSGNIWKTKADFIVITTNGDVRRDGKAVMGRGIARQAKQRFPGIDQWFGQTLNDLGNHVHWIMRGPNIITFPVKRHWHEKADLELIERSCIELAYWRIEQMRQDVRFASKTIALPRPGCGNGQLQWKEVRPVVKKHLRGKQFIVYYEEGHD